MQAATAHIATLRVRTGAIVLHALGGEARTGAGRRAAGLGGSSGTAERQGVAAVAEVKRLTIVVRNFRKPKAVSFVCVLTDLPAVSTCVLTVPADQ